MNLVEGMVDEDSNIVPVELDVGNASTKLLVEVELVEPSHEETSSSATQNEKDLQTYSLAREWKRRKIHPPL